MLSQYLISEKIEGTFESHTIGFSINIYNNELNQDVKIALLGLADFNDSTPFSVANSIRNEFYQLSATPIFNKSVLDLGNLIPGESDSDTHFALGSILKELFSKNVIPVIINANYDSASIMFEELSHWKKPIEMAYVSSNMPMQNGQFLYEAINSKKVDLLNLSSVGVQGHRIHPKALQSISDMGFNTLRLGTLTSEIEESEILLRNADTTLINLDVLKMQESPGCINAGPTGITSENACQIGWYAGLSDTLKAFSLLGYNVLKDVDAITAKLMGQLIWYFIDGVAHRKQDHPKLHQEFTKYRCTFDNKHPDILFYKSKLTSRWWMEIDNISSKTIMPCLYSDYQQATKGDMPDRYLNALQRIR